MTRAEAAMALAAVLREENAALERHDFAAAGALVHRKTAAAQALAEAPAGTVPPQAARELAARELATLAETNRRLLEQALTVQRQVIATVARAASAGPASGGRYARTGAHVRATPGQALMSRA